MATGMVSSAQAQQTAPTLRSGEKLATTPQALKDPKAKVFKHLIPGARFIMPDGLEIQFLGGQFVTTDPAIIRELESVANKSTSMIYTESAAAQAAVSVEKQAAGDAADTAGTSPEK